LYLGGLCHSQDTEDQDRTGLELPYNQDALIAAITKVNPNIVAVLWGGGPMLMPWLSQVRAVLLPWYAGMEGGSALAEVLSGTADPGGRLPCTFPMQLKDSPAHALGDYNGTRIEHREGIFVGYRWADAKTLAPLFPFGHGLSYAQFAWSDMRVRRDQGKTLVSCRITNTSKRFGSEVVQLYVAPCVAPPNTSGTWPRPPKELKAFHKVSLDPGASCSVELVLDQKAFAFWNPDTRDWFVEAGDYQLLLAASSQDVRLQAKVSISAQDPESLGF
jgi:beta-glucosidase